MQREESYLGCETGQKHRSNVDRQANAHHMSQILGVSPREQDDEDPLSILDRQSDRPDRIH